MDYFAKWVEAKPYAIITLLSVTRFLWKTVVCRYAFPNHHSQQQQIVRLKPLLELVHQTRNKG